MLFRSIAEWVDNSDWAAFLAVEPAVRSSTSVCLKIVDPWFQGLDADAQASVPKKIDVLLEAENAAYDIASYRDAPPGLRIWGGATVEASDLQCLTAWLNWAFEETAASLAS